jgi:hypothetical protein
MAQELGAGAIQLLQLLKNEKEFVSPLFQRRYVWGTAELKQLWEDIDGILDGSAGTRFLGALVLEIKSAGLAFKPDSMWIVDGQQRISTLYMILVRVAIESEQAHADELAASLYRQYLFNQDGDYKNSPKLHPTFLDYKQFNDAFTQIHSFTPRLAAPYGDLHGQMKKAYEQISKQVRERCLEGEQFSETKARSLVAALLEKLKFVQIVLGESDDSHQVFDRMNAGGVRLESKDLIRNIVFESVAKSPTDALALYNGRWLPFEQGLGQRLDSYFFPFGLIHKASVTKSSLLRALRDRWHNKGPEEIMSDLEVFVPAFNALTGEDALAVQTFSDSEDVTELLFRLRRMRVPSSTHSFLLRLLNEYRNGTVSEDWVVKNITQLDSFLVRRAFAGYEPTGLHAVFKDLWAKTQGDPAKFVEEFDKNPTVHFPDDLQFQRDIKEKPLYGRRLAPYILLEYERGLRGGDPVPDISPTIDHVMPDALAPAWEAVVTAEDHKALKDTWANLVILSGPANSEKGQKKWADVKHYFQTETVFKTTKRLAQEYSAWDATTIRQRAEHLASWAVNRWPRTA